MTKQKAQKDQAVIPECFYRGSMDSRLKISGMTWIFFAFVFLLAPKLDAAEVAPKAVTLPSPPAKAEAVKEEHPIVRTMEQTSGEVTGISPEHISVLYNKTEDAEYEVNIPLDQKVQLEHYKKLSDIQVGDKIGLKYEKVVEYPKMPNERRYMKVKKINFIKRPSQNKALRSGDNE